MSAPAVSEELRMAFALRRAATRVPLPLRARSSRRLSSTAIPDAALDAVPSTFIQTPPFWVRFTWPLIIGNALLLTSAIDITWSHWSTLVEDLEAVGERNRQNVAAAAAEAKRRTDPPASSSSSAPPVEAETNNDQTDTLASTSTPPTTVDTSKKEEPAYIWERRPTWQRAAFCGIYVTGWAFSTAYLLKYRQTYVTRVKFFRWPSSPKPLSPPTPILASSSKTIPPSPPPPPAKSTRGSAAINPPTKGSQENRFIHLQTASKPKGITIPLAKLSLYEGRNETELVIRSNPSTGTNSATSRWNWNRTGREYWFMSLSDAIVDGTRSGKVESARDKVLQAWFGGEEEGAKKKKKGKKGSS